MTGKDKIAGRCPFCGGKMEEKHGFYGGLYFYCGVRLPAARGEQYVL